MMKVIEAKDDSVMKQVLDVRFQVFVHEQHVPEEEEIDDFENEAVHFIGYDDNNQPVAAGRYRISDGCVKVERICVLASHRQTGAGKAIMTAIESHARQQGETQAKLNAQRTAVDFYKKLGYDVTSGEFLEARIPHVEMKKNL